MKIVVLGAGLVGLPMALDLANEKNFEVTIVDINPKSLDKAKTYKELKILQSDLSSAENVKEIIKPYDLVISAVPGFMGFQTLKTIIEAKKNVVDIAFFPENPFELNKLAQENNITAIVDCGVAPGMSHILTGYVNHLLDELTKVRIYVGGLPVVRTWPYEYKAVFSPIDVLEEYTRPSRLVENGKMVVKPALSENELLDFPGVGTLEAFNSDGLRTLVETIDAPDMAEKTLRYPGHIQIMEVLRHSGFFNKNEIEINGSKISPLDVTAELLKQEWKLGQGEKDLTVMQVILEGIKGKEKFRYQYDLLDYFDEETEIHSMARTTGYTATVVARLLLEGKISRQGIIVPEFLGEEPEVVTSILQGLRDRKIDYRESIEKIS